MSKARRHTHKYHRVSLDYANVWACALPECSHYMPKHIERLVLGKKSHCWGCDAQFILDEDALKMDKPMCIPCRTGIQPQVDEIEAPITPELQALLDQLK